MSNENQRTSIPVQIKFFIRLFLFTFCAWAIPHMAYRYMQLNMGTITISFNVNSLSMLFLGLALVSGFGVGLVVSIMQWFALRPYVQFTWLWLVGLTLVWIIGDVVNTLLITVAYRIFPDLDYLQSVLFRLIGHSLVTGILAGIIQQALLQKRTGIRFWWFVSAIFSILSAKLIYTGNLTLREGFLIIDPIYASLISGVVMATLASLPTLLLKSDEMSDTNQAP